MFVLVAVVYQYMLVHLNDSTKKTIYGLVFGQKLREIVETFTLRGIAVIL